MPRRGRKPHTDPPVRVEITVPQTVIAKLDLLLSDPLTARTKYGARSRLITRLIREWLLTKQKETKETA